jgi:ketosteroid isomerase-like protein
MVTRLWPATFLLVLTAACAAETPAPGVDAVKEVRAVLTAQIDAWNRGDLEGYMAGYWKSPELVFFSNGTETRGWQATLDRYRTRYQADGTQMGVLDFPELDIVTLGQNAAIARGRWHLKMPDGKDLGGMTTVIFRRLPEGWRIVHDHSSAESS